MRRLLVLALLLFALPVGAQDWIRYYPPGGASVTSSGSSFFAGGISLGNTLASPYANLYGDAANTLALRNSTNAQTFNIYNTYTDASNYERGGVKWSGNILEVFTESAGTGSARAIRLNPSTSVSIGGPLTPSANDARDFGAVTLYWRDVFFSRSIQGSKTKALTAGAATTVATVAVPQTAGSNFAAGEVKYTVYATDATDTQTLNGVALFSAVNKAGTESCQLEDDQITTEASSSGTLTCTVACAVGLTDVVGITFDCASSLTETTLNALVRFDMQQPNTLVFP